MNVLTDLLPPRVRAVLYALVAFAGVVYGIWQAVGGDWRQFTVAVIAALTGALAGANVDTTDPADQPIMLGGVELTVEERSLLRQHRAA